MPKISLMVHTASCDNFLQNQGIHSYFHALIKNLEYQTFKDFEFIFVDTFYEDNRDIFSQISASFPVKHVPIHPRHRYWYDQGYVYISAAKNTGILHADGELLITCDDAEFFPEQAFELYWKHYQKGYYMQALHKRMKNIHHQDGFPVFPINGDIYINDHRLNTMTQQVKHHHHGTLSFAGSCFSLKDALHLNGFNERMDGCKSLEDCDFGQRLELIGKKFVHDKQGFLYILDHQSYCDIPTTVEDGQRTLLEAAKVQRKKIDNFIAVENFGVLRASQELMEPQVNKYPITEAHLKIIQRETLKYRKFDPLAAEQKAMLDIWLKTPMFNLKKEREELRHDAH